jgi:hypothetical protein
MDYLNDIISLMPYHAKASHDKTTIHQAKCGAKPSGFAPRQNPTERNGLVFVVVPAPTAAGEDFTILVGSPLSFAQLHHIEHFHFLD